VGRQFIRREDSPSEEIREVSPLLAFLLTRFAEMKYNELEFSFPVILG
jgi:hypothetical protein